MNKTFGHEPAFPEVQPTPQFNNHTYGITKREYFAASALQGLIANNSENQYEYALDDDELCEEAVNLAEKLIEKLNRENDQ